MASANDYKPLNKEEILIRIKEAIDFLRYNQGLITNLEEDRKYFGRMIRGLIQAKQMLKEDQK